MTRATDQYNDGASDLRELAEGDIVRMKPFRSGDKIWKKATVSARLDERSYTVETPDGGVYHRTRRAILEKCQKERRMRPAMTVKVWRRG